MSTVALDLTPEGEMGKPKVEPELQDRLWRGPRRAPDGEGPGMVGAWGEVWLLRIERLACPTDRNYHERTQGNPRVRTEGIGFRLPSIYGSDSCCRC